MKTCALLISVLFLFTVKVKSQTAAQLERAYKEKSTVKLRTFFEAWAKELPPATPEQRKEMRQPLQEAYQVFESFYNPHNLAGRGGSEFGNDIYKGFNYFIIQRGFKIYQKDKVYYTEDEEKAYAIDYITKNVDKKYHDNFIKWIKEGRNSILSSYGPNKSVWEDSSKVLIDSVQNFRPSITQTKATPLFINDKYQKLLDGFLGNTHSAFAEGGIMNTAKAKGESAERQKFLEGCIKIFYAHWGGHWEYNTDPSISAIIFDKNLEYAKVFYGIVYEGGEALMKKETDGWKLLSMKRTWIQ